MHLLNSLMKIDEPGENPDTPVLYLWDDLILMIRRCPDNMTKKIMVDTFIINLEKDCLVSNDEGHNWTKCRSALWPSYSPRKWQSNEIMAYVLMEPTYIYRRAVRKNMQMQHKDFFSHHINEEYVADCFRYIYNTHPDPETTYKLIFTALMSPKFSYKYCSHIGLDKRTEALMRKIKDTSSWKYSIKDYGSMVNLSESRVEHLFRNETAMPITQYKQFCRLRTASAYIKKFNSISTAAIEAGFSDLSHYSRTFKQVTGMAPSKVHGSEGNQKKMEIMVSENLTGIV